MQDRPHRRLNLTQPYGQSNGSTLTAPENGHGHAPEPEPVAPQVAASAVEPVLKSGEDRPAYLVVPLDSASEPLISALRPPTTPIAPLPPTQTTSRGWLLPALGGVALGAVVVAAAGAFVFGGSFTKPASRPATVPKGAATAKTAPKVTARPVIQANAAGELLLQGGQATVHGKKIRQEDNSIGYWDGSDCYVTWVAEAPRAGRYAVALTLSVGENCGGSYIVQGGESWITARSRSTGGWSTNRTVALGTLTLPKGRTTITVRPNGKLTAPLMVLRALRLTPASAQRSAQTKPEPAAQPA